MLRLLDAVLCEPRVHYWVTVNETDGLWGSRDLQFPEAGALLYYVAKSSRTKRTRFDAGYEKRALAVSLQVPECQCGFGEYKRATLSLFPSRSRMQYGPGELWLCTPSVVSIITLLHYCCQSTCMPKAELMLSRKNGAVSKGERKKNYDRDDREREREKEKKWTCRRAWDWITWNVVERRSFRYIHDRPIPRERSSPCPG